MSPEIKAKWIEALRSGRYRQARYQLRSANGFCCLGVLCDVEGVEWRMNCGDRNEWNAVFDGVFYWGDLPGPFSERVGLTIDQAGVLSEMNDHGKSFADIAKHIEKHL